MSSNHPQLLHSLPLLDRLIDKEPGGPPELPLGESQYLEQLRLGVSRDLQDLLNTRIRWSPTTGDVSSTDDSLIDYGLPDFTSASLNLAYDTGALKAAMLRAISVFEPRLTAVKIHTITDAWHLDRVFRFRIEAVLLVERQRVTVQFSSLLLPGTGQFSVGDA